MSKRLFRRIRKNGSQVGPSASLGAAPVDKIKATIISYGDAYCEQVDVRGNECRPPREDATITWVDVDDVHQTDLLNDLGSRYGLHPLVLEDIQSPNQRPKLDDYDDYLYIVLRMFYPDRGRDEVHAEQVSIAFGPGWVLSFQEGNRDVFDGVRERIRTGKGRVRKAGSDYLAYSLIDAVVDSYFATMEKLGDKIDDIEEELVSDPRPERLDLMHGLKRDLILMRSSIWPLREVIGRLQRGESPLVQEHTRVYLRDVYDHTIQVVETVETYRDILSGLLDIYLSSVSNRLNAVMKVLTIMSTVFMPLTVITGFYGMNFRYIPLLDQTWGYFAILVFMLAISAAMLLYFRNKKWF